MSNKVKKTFVTFDTPKYIVNKESKVTVCIIDCSWNNKSTVISDIWIRKVCNIIEDKFPEYNRPSFKVVGVARCSENDTYNEIVGKRIAESKAKAEAFNKIWKLLSATTKAIKEELNNNDAMIAINCKVACDSEIEHIKFLSDNNEKDK